MNNSFFILCLVLIISYLSIALNLTTPIGIVYLTSIYIFFSMFIKIWVDGGINISLFYISAVSYFYFIAREIWFYNPMLREFKEGEVLQSVFIISLAACIISIVLGCHSNRKFKNLRIRKKTNKLFLKRWLVLILFVFYVLMMAIPAYSTLTQGRVAVYAASFSSLKLLVPFLNAIGYLLPIFIHLSFKGTISQNIFKFGAIALVFLIQIGMGNRFVILFSFFIYLSMIVDVSKVGVKNVVIPILILSILSLLMKELRGGAGSEVDIQSSSQSTEGLIYYFSGLIRYYSETSHSYLPVYSTFFLYFMIPRVLWADKPELIGSWLLDTGVFMTRFGDAHSGSVSFVGPFYADFGVLFFVPVVFLSLILVKLDKYLVSHIGEQSKKGIIAASFIPLVFFGYRSFNTAVAAELVLLFIVYIVIRANKVNVTS